MKQAFEHFFIALIFVLFLFIQCDDDNFVFNLSSKSYTYIKIETMSPPISGTDNATTVWISVQFSQPIKPNTFSESFSLYTDVGYVSLSQFIVSWSSDMKSVILKPRDVYNPPLLLNKVYQFSLSTKLRSEKDNPMANTYSSSFATGSFGGDIVAPNKTILCVNAQSGQVCEPPAGNINGKSFNFTNGIEITFDEAMIPVTVESAFTLSVGGKVVVPNTISWRNYNKKVIFGFNSVPTGTASISLNNTALDTSGNALAAGSVIAGKSFISTQNYSHVSTPTFTPSPGTYSIIPQVTTSTATTGATIPN